MRTLIVYFSKTGNTEILAKELASALGAEIEPVVETNPRKGFIGMLVGGKDAFLQKTTPINDMKNKITDYDLVVIGTPIWGWTMTSPIRSFMEKYKTDFKKVAFFSTKGGSGDKRAFSQMQEIGGLAPIATITVIDKQIKNGAFKILLGDFVKKLKNPD
jgi:flavodoxin